MVDLSKPRSIHVIGVAGSVMGGMACLLKERGHDVRGSDRDCYPPMSDRLQGAGVQVRIGFDARNIEERPPDLVIVGNITRRTNPEAEAMRRLGLPHASLPEVLAETFLRERRSLTVAGTHGKTTTTSMITWLLTAAGLDPGYLIGGIPMGFDSGLAAGSGPHFVLEADEYDTAYFDKRPKLVHYLPDAAILTSVEFDHADIYPNFDAVRSSFRTYARLLEPGGTLWVHGADEEALAAASVARCSVRTYGIEGEATLKEVHACARVKALALGDAPSVFELSVGGRDMGAFELDLPGLHNIRNATAALAVCLGEGVDADELRKGLGSFRGVKRRQELRGRPRGIEVIQDYAHHPTAVRETVAAIRARFPGRRLWALFEAESNTSRRRTFQQAYVEAFMGADQVIFVKPLEKDDKLPTDERIDAARLAADLAERGVAARFVPDADEILKLLKGELRPDDVALFMSGRDFLGLPARLVEELS